MASDRFSGWCGPASVGSGVSIWPAVCIDQAIGLDGEAPVGTGRQHGRACSLRHLGDALRDRSGIAHRDERNPGLGDPGLFARNRFGGIPQEALMIDAELRDAGGDRVRQYVGGIEPPAKPDLDDARIRRRPAEG